MINTATIMGRLTDDPMDREYLKADGSKGVSTSFVLAVNETSTKTSFIPCVYYGENRLRECVERGDRLVVSGRLSQRKYMRQDGSMASVIELIISSFNFVEPPKEEPKAPKQEEEEYHDPLDNGDDTPLPF